MYSPFLDRQSKVSAMSSHHHSASSDATLTSALMERLHRSNTVTEQQLRNRYVHEDEDRWTPPLSAGRSSLPPYHLRESSLEETYGRRHPHDWRSHSSPSIVSERVSAAFAEQDDGEDVEIQRMIQELDDMRAALTVRKQARDAMAAVRQRTVQMLSKKQEASRSSLRSFLAPPFGVDSDGDFSSTGRRAQASPSSMTSRSMSKVLQSRVVEELSPSDQVPPSKILLAPQQQSKQEVPISIGHSWRLPLPPLTPLQGAPPKCLIEYTVPLPNDVLLGRGKTTCAHEGNRQFLELVATKKETYVSSTKKHKKVIAKALVQQVKDMGGRFLQKSPLTGMWLVVDDCLARDKTSRALRDGAPAIRKNLEQKNEAAQALFALTGTKN